MSGDLCQNLRTLCMNHPSLLTKLHQQESPASDDLDVSTSTAANLSTCMDDFHFTESSHPQHVLLGLNHLRLSNSFCDVTICVGEQEFPCHRIVLASFSPYFKAMFSGELAESRQDRVSINGLEASMVELLIGYAYTAELIITKANVQWLLSAANLLEVLPVRDACCGFMERNMDETNSIGIHCFAEAHACFDLQDKAKNFVLRHFADVCNQEEFLSLSQPKLIEFISDDNLFVEYEELVFNSVIRWLEHDVESRKPDFHLILEHVRLPLISPYFLHDCVSQHRLISDRVECMKLVDEAKTYHLLTDRHHELRTNRTMPRKASGTTEVIIAVGGEDDKVVLRSVESYDPYTRLWKTMNCLPFAVSKHGLVVSGTNMVYMAGGEFPDGLSSCCVWRYDPSLNSWAEMASMNTPRSELGMAMLDGYIYAAGGWEGSERLDSVERYDPAANMWCFVAPMKISVTSPAVAAYDGKLYVTGGAVLEDGDGIDLVQCYNPRTNSWSELSPMMIPRSGSAACVLNGFIYVIGGWHASTENTNKVECYNAAMNRWTMKAEMHERRYRPGVAVVNGKIYVCGGEEGWDRYHDTIECYNEEEDVWEIVGEMPTSRSWLSCVAVTVRKDLLSNAKDALAIEV